MSPRYRATSVILTAVVLAAAAEAAAASRSSRRRVRTVRAVRTTPTVTKATVTKASRREVRPALLSLPPLVLPPEASLHDQAVGDACRRALGRANGGVVAMDPRTGRVMALVNPGQALHNAYQPCSVFKIVVAVAGLTEGVITPDTTYNCVRGCWMWPGHGTINLRRALAVSCNPYFESIGEQLGYEKIQRYAHLLGLGTPSGINLTGETAGRMPLQVGSAFVGHLSSHAEGISTSAVQLAVLLSAAINGGIVFQPQVHGEEGFQARERWRLPEGTVLDGLAEGFLGAVNEGSASSAFDPDVMVAGKTGSCSHVGWFASYAPADHPEMVVVVFLRPGNGHLASAVAGRIYQDLYKPMAETTALTGP
jgi:penicillin-binding protein 2